MRGLHFHSPVTGVAVLCLGLAQFAGAAQTLSPSPRQTSPAAYRTDRILIQPKPEISPAAFAGLHAVQGTEVLRTFEGIGRLQVLRVPEGKTVPSLIGQYEQSGLVEFAEPDFIRSVAAAPNDPKYLDGTLWGLNNTGQSGGTVDADIDAPEGWDVLTSASNVVVAVLDTGVRFTHEDLASNMWVNPGDGGHGFNALTETNNPNDDQGHGTLMSGVLGGVGDNGKGVVGVAWRVQIMALKCLDSAGTGSDSDIIACIDYARTNGARIINASFDSPAFSQSLSNAIYATRNDGVIFVASSGNNSLNVDVNPRYPACYDIDNIVSVAFTTRGDALGAVSNYGSTNVDLAAPGEQMYSTFFASDSSYLGGSFLQGSSFAAPYVAGALALTLAQHPAETYRQIINRVLNGTDPLPTLTEKCVTGGRLNLRKVLQPPLSLTSIPTPGTAGFRLRLSGDATRSYVIEFATNLASWSAIFTNTTLADGTFDFTDDQSTTSGQRFYRARSSP